MSKAKNTNNQNNKAEPFEASIEPEEDEEEQE